MGGGGGTGREIGAKEQAQQLCRGRISAGHGIAAQPSANTATYYLFLGSMTTRHHWSQSY